MIALAAAALVSGAAVTASPVAVVPDDLARQAASMLLVGAPGDEVKAGGAFEELICGLKVGGIILFDRDTGGRGEPRNIRSREQVARLTREMQALARRCGDAPLLLAADVEGGVVNRLAPLDGLDDLPSAAELGAGSTERTRAAGRRIGEAMAQAGLNWDLAPVVDLDLNADSPAIGRWKRSFSDDPKVVARHARAFAEGLYEHGVLSCLKHFPGHGSSRGDSHKGAVDVTETARPGLEMEPYRILIEQDLADCVMPGHLYNENLDPEDIATVSTAVVTGLLREELGYDGIVLTDDLQMGAVKESYSLEEAAVRAVVAGADMLTLSNAEGRRDADKAKRVLAALLNAVKDGRLSRRRIVEANLRIKRFKSRLPGLDRGGFDLPPPEPDPEGEP
ncbi:MAG: glycoside hydrolase family 3 protein [Elusimicrobia bacterium]|nr:glycoside hydrolase family 3 protein [Elusimicrobiota bacterium]